MATPDEEGIPIDVPTKSVRIGELDVELFQNGTRTYAVIYDAAEIAKKRLAADDRIGREVEILGPDPLKTFQLAVSTAQGNQSPAFARIENSDPAINRRIRHTGPDIGRFFDFIEEHNRIITKHHKPEGTLQTIGLIAARAKKAAVKAARAVVKALPFQHS